MSHAQNLPVFLTSMLNAALLKAPTESIRRYLREPSPCKTSLTSDVSICKKNTLQRSQASLCVAILTHTVATVPRISRSTCFSTCSFNIFMHLIIASIDAKWLLIKAQRQSSGPLQYRQIMQVFEMWIRESYIEHNRIYDYRMQQVKKTKCSGKQTLQTPWLQEYLPLVVPFIQSQHLPQKEPTRHKSWKPMEKWSRWQTFHAFPSFPAIDSKIQLFRLYGCREL